MADHSGRDDTRIGLYTMVYTTRYGSRRTLPDKNKAI